MRGTGWRSVTLPRRHHLGARGVRRFYLVDTGGRHGRSDFWWRIFDIERCLEKARGDRGLSSPNPVVIVCREVQ
jgi:hypothetical protein